MVSVCDILDTANDVLSALLPKINTFGYLIMGFMLSYIFVVIHRYYDITLPFVLMPALTCFVFYVIGYFIRIEQDKLPKLLLLIAIITWIYCIFHERMIALSIFYTCFPLNVIGAIGGVVVMYLLAKVLLIPGLAWIGVNSLAFLFAHCVERFFYPWRFIPYCDNPFLHIALEILFCLLFTICAGKVAVFRKLFGIKLS